jgi:Sel1 repeat
LRYKNQKGKFAESLIRNGETDVPTFELVKRIADVGDPVAAFELANYSHFEKTVNEHELKNKYYRQAAEAGFVAGMYELGVELKQSAEGVHWLERAAENGSSSAARRLVDCYQYGRDGCSAPDFGKAARWLELAAREQAPSELPRYQMIDGAIAIAYDQNSFNFDDLASTRGKGELFKFLLLGLGMPRNEVEALNILESLEPTNYSNYLKAAVKGDDSVHIALAINSSEFKGSARKAQLRPLIEMGAILPYAVPDLAKAIVNNSLKLEDFVLNRDQIRLLLSPSNDVYVVKKSFEWDKLLSSTVGITLVFPPGIDPPKSGPSRRAIVLKAKQKT